MATFLWQLLIWQSVPVQHSVGPIWHHISMVYYPIGPIYWYSSMGEGRVTADRWQALITTTDFRNTTATAYCELAHASCPRHKLLWRVHFNFVIIAYKLISLKVMCVMVTLWLGWVSTNAVQSLS